MDCFLYDKDLCHKRLNKIRIDVDSCSEKEDKFLETADTVQGHHHNFQGRRGSWNNGTLINISSTRCERKATQGKILFFSS